MALFSSLKLLHSYPAGRDAAVPTPSSSADLEKLESGREWGLIGWFAQGITTVHDVTECTAPCSWSAGVKRPSRLDCWATMEALSRHWTYGMNNGPHYKHPGLPGVTQKAPMHPAWPELVEDSEAGLTGRRADGLHSPTDLLPQMLLQVVQTLKSHLWIKPM